VPQRKYNKGAGRGNAENQDLVIFLQENGSYLRVMKALGEDYAGLIGRDQEVLPGAGYTISVRFEVNRPAILSNILIFIDRAVAGVSTQSLPSELAVMVPQELAETRNFRSGPSIGVNRPTSSPSQNSPRRWQRQSKNLSRYGTVLYWVECTLISRRKCNGYK
jgi:hypothetical protein